MSYGSSPQSQMGPYAKLMQNYQLCCGFWAPNSSPTQDDINWLYTNGYAGVMVYAVTESGGPNLLNTLLTYWSNAQSGG